MNRIVFIFLMRLKQKIILVLHSGSIEDKLENLEEQNSFYISRGCATF